MNKNMSLELLQFLWDSGSYDLSNMIDLVLDKQITEEDFFEITRYNFRGLTDNKKREEL